MRVGFRGKVGVKRQNIQFCTFLRVLINHKNKCVCCNVPVGEVQYCLNGISSTLTDVSFKAGQQRNDNKHPELLPFTRTTQIKHTIHAREHRIYFTELVLVYLTELYYVFPAETDL